MGDGDWWRHGVVYQVYPRSFGDTDGNGVGDLPGVTAHLDHLAWLGVDAIWLSPFYPSPGADFGYDVSDHTDVDPLLGTLADFDALLAEAHRRGIRVLVDLVPNHTSDQHPWFVASRSSRDDPKRDWYVWRDPRPDGGPPNNWPSSFAETGDAWTLDEETGQYYLHSFTPHQPDLNWWNPEVRAAMDEILRFWLDRGADGFRIDVAHRLGKDRDLRDNPLEIAHHRKHVPGLPHPQLHLNGAEGHVILRAFRRTLDDYDDRMAVGEAMILDPAELARYYGEGDELHLAFNFALTFLPWAADGFRAAADALEAALPPGAWPSVTLSNHDISRIASRHGDAQARVAAMMVLTLRGTPFLYYGDELGLRDVPIPPQQRRDPDGRDPQRTPMPWAPGPGRGFTTGTPWLPFGPDEVNVAAQGDDPASMLTLHRRLLALRRASPALHRGAYTPLDGPEGVFAYVRHEARGEGGRSAAEAAGAPPSRSWALGDDAVDASGRGSHDRMLVVLEFTGRGRAVALPGVPAAGQLEVSTDPGRTPGLVALDPLRLGSHEGVVVRLPG